MRAQSVSVDRAYFSTQTGSDAVNPNFMPYALELNVRGTPEHSMSAWGPGFFIPGSGGVPQSGTSSATNTGTLNFSATPNNYSDFQFIHHFATDTELAGFYPTGAYGVKFLGANPPSPAVFTAGLDFAVDGFPATAPKVTAVDNGARWTSGVLKLSATGTTTLTLNAFPEYQNHTVTQGAFMTAGIYGNGTVIGAASIENYYVPSLSLNDPELTQVSINSEWLEPGIVYTLELRYGVVASAPASSDLTAPGATTATNFQGLATYYNDTTISITLDTPGSGKAADFNGDTRPDILFQNSSTGEIGAWTMNGTVPTAWIPMNTVSTAWKIAGTGDFTSDGKPDILFQNSATGEIGLWSMDGTTPIAWIPMNTVSTAWKIVGTPDLTGDGKPDILFQNSNTGEIGLWSINGTTATAWIPMNTVLMAWKIVATADFTNDGKTDILFQNSDTGEIGAWSMNGTTPTAWIPMNTVLTPWKIVTAADFTNDGKPDILFQNSDTGEIGAWSMNGTTPTAWIPMNTVATSWKIVNH